MAVDKQELKATLLAYAMKAAKSQLYLKDLSKADPNASPREVKNAANELVKEGKLKFWSSGSTTMYACPDRAKDEEKRGVN